MIEKIDKALARAEIAVSSVMLVGVVVTVLMGVIMRFVLKMPNKYGEEISRYLTLGCISLGISIGVRERAHLGIDSLVKALPKKTGRVVQLLADILSAFVYILLTVLAVQFVTLIKGFGQASPAMTFLPMHVVYSVLLVGFLLAGIRSLLLIWQDYIK